MKTRHIALGIVASMSLAVAFVLWANHGAGEQYELRKIVLGSVLVSSAHAATPGFSSDQAEQAARKAAADYLANAVGPSVPVNGRQIAASDLERIEAGFAPGAIEVRFTMSGAVSTYPKPTDLWVFEFRAAGVSYIDVEIEDGTGSVKGIGAAVQKGR